MRGRKEEGGQSVLRGESPSASLSASEGRAMGARRGSRLLRLIQASCFDKVAELSKVTSPRSQATQEMEPSSSDLCSLLLPWQRSRSGGCEPLRMGSTSSHASLAPPNLSKSICKTSINTVRKSASCFKPGHCNNYRCNDYLGETDINGIIKDECGLRQFSKI